jgi:hypothetical protein
MNTPDTESVLWGTLERKGPDEWVWSDGSPEPSVTDMSGQSAYNFRVRNYADYSYIEVPTVAVREDDQLTWVREHHTRKGLDGDQLDRVHAREQAEQTHTDVPEVYLVPVTVWDRWAKNTVVGAEWPIDEQQRILERARKLRDNPDVSSD